MNAVGRCHCQLATDKILVTLKRWARLYRVRLLPGCILGWRKLGIIIFAKVGDRIIDTGLQRQELL
jgi:hypothetical protein